MTNPKQTDTPSGNVEKEPDDGVTGDEKMTGAQASYLKTLCEEAGEDFNENLTKAEASQTVEEALAERRRCPMNMSALTSFGSVGIIQANSGSAAKNQV